MIRVAVAAGQRHGLFEHEALLYAGERGFLLGTVPFIEDGLAAGEPVLVVVAAPKIERLRRELGRSAGRVLFADMDAVGSNPARIIPAWREFVAEHAGGGRPVRGIGEPISADRTDAALVECQRHEELLNLAFADAPAWRLMCPYDTESLDEPVIDEALRSHPYVVDADGRAPSHRYRGLRAIASPFDRPLAEAPADARELPFDRDALLVVRHLVGGSAEEAGIGESRAADLVLAVNEVATNSIRYGGGAGTLRIWTEPEHLICEITDLGRIEDPLVGRERPYLGRENGRGLWIANQVCELVQVRSFAEGTTIRLHMRRS